MKLLGRLNASCGYLIHLMQSAAGSALVSFSLAAPVLIGIVGLATDLATYSMKVAELQAVADTSALGGANELALAGTSDDAVKSVAISYVTSQLADKEDAVTSAAEVNIGAHMTPIRVDATASLAGMTNICILALDDSGPKAVHMDKSAKLKANNCEVYSNSTHSEGIRLDQNSSVVALSICSAGGYKAKTTSVNPLPTTDCPAVPDPLLGRAPPVAGSCDKTGFAINNGSQILDPGTYCGGLKISGTASVTFKPGTYVIKDGKFTVSNSAKIIGTHVAFYLLGNASLIDFKDDASVTLTGAADGNMAGLLFFEDRAANLGRKHRIKANNVDVLTGTIYLPRGKLLIDPDDTVAKDSAYTAIIAYQLELDEGPELTMNTDYGATDVPVPAGLRSSSQVVLSE
jgi:Flp pilus assembly protein TadG